MKKKSKIILFVALGLVLVGIFIIAWRFDAHFEDILPHKPIVLGLPMDPKYDSGTTLIPLGETINHNFPGGHPGIDVLWEKDTPVIAMADGEVISTQRADDSHGKYDVRVKSGVYEIHYDEFDEIAPEIVPGAKIARGQFIGYPQRKGHGLHLEFALRSAKGKTQRLGLCPMTYFDAESRARIEKIWAATPEHAYKDMKIHFPDICSGYYKGKVEPSWLLLK